MTTLKQMKQEFEKLRKEFLILKKGKKYRYVDYFPRGWFLIDGTNALFLGRNWQLANVKLLTLNPNKRFSNQAVGFYLPPALYCGSNYCQVLEMGFEESIFPALVEMRKADFWDLRPP